jgi:hypothetical protein
MNAQPYSGELLSGLNKLVEKVEKDAKERSNERGNPYDLVPGTTAWQSAIDQTRHSSQREE